MRRPPAFRTLIILGALGIIGGLILGFSSHQITYRSVGQSTIAHFLSSSSDNTGYFQMEGSSTLYIINENDFTPAINGTQTFVNGDVISFVYQPDDTKDVDITSTIGTHLQGTAYRIVQITANNGGQQRVYTTAAYSQNPQGSYQNNWLSGIGIALVGLLLFIGAFFVKSKPQPGFSISPAGAIGGMPPANPYQQPYPNAGPYQQQPDPYAQPQYGGQQPTQYAQPPYQQPQQPPDPYAQPPYQPPPNPYNNYPPQN